MLIRVLDFETDGVDPKTCHPLECAALTYDTVTKRRKDKFSTLIWTPMYPEIPEEITELTGISRATMAAEEYLSPGGFVDAFRPSVRGAGMMCSYNASFDRAIYEKLYRSFEMALPGGNPPWFDAMTDIPYPKRLMRCRQLQHRALDLGLPMDDRIKHRAMADVETICDIFDLYDMEAVLAYHAIPWTYILAIIPEPWKDDGRGRDLAKAAGFGWECAPGDERKFKKRWAARFKQGTEIPKFDFETELFL